MTTTGGSLLSSICQLQSQGVSVTTAITLTDRGDTQAIRSALADLGVQYFFLSDGQQVMRHLLDNMSLSDHIKEAIQEELCHRSG